MSAAYDLARIATRRERAYNVWRMVRAGEAAERAWVRLMVLDAALHAAELDALYGPVTRCGCGAEYTLRRFRRLPRPLYQRFTDGAGPPILESRACQAPTREGGAPCGSHCSIWTDNNGTPVPEPKE